jgi:hypothetical protein
MDRRRRSRTLRRNGHARVPGDRAEIDPVEAAFVCLRRIGGNAGRRGPGIGVIQSGDGESGGSRPFDRISGQDAFHDGQRFLPEEGGGAAAQEPCAQLLTFGGPQPSRRADQVDDRGIPVGPGDGPLDLDVEAVAGCGQVDGPLDVLKIRDKRVHDEVVGGVPTEQDRQAAIRGRDLPLVRPRAQERGRRLGQPRQDLAEAAALPGRGVER